MSGPTLSSSQPSNDEPLFESLRRGDTSARDVLVRRYLPLAHKLAHGYYCGDEYEDLEQVAAIGLLKAIDRFEPERGLAFSTYAFPTIMGEIKRYFRDRGWSVRVPRALQELMAHVERVSAELTGQAGRAPTVAEIAERVDATSERVLEALRARTARYAHSLDLAREGEGGEALLAGELAVEERGFARIEDAAMLDGFMRVLSPNDRLILSMRFREDLMQAEIGTRVGISQMQVSRSIHRSIDRLRQTAVRV